MVSALGLSLMAISTCLALKHQRQLRKLQLEQQLQALDQKE
jgi:hypothetical protein